MSPSHITSKAIQMLGRTLVPDAQGAAAAAAANGQPGPLLELERERDDAGHHGHE